MGLATSLDDLKGKEEGKGEVKCKDKETERQSQKRKQMWKQKEKDKSKGQSKAEATAAAARSTKERTNEESTIFQKKCNFQSLDSALATVETLPKQVNGRNSNSHFSYVNLI